MLTDAVCRKCGGTMKPGKAMGQTAVARRALRGPNDSRTFYAGGTGRLIGCLKCEKCGWSVTTGKLEKGD